MYIVYLIEMQTKSNESLFREWNIFYISNFELYEKMNKSKRHSELIMHMSRLILICIFFLSGCSKYARKAMKMNAEYFILLYLLKRWYFPRDITPQTQSQMTDYIAIMQSFKCAVPRTTYMHTLRCTNTLTK